MTLCAWWADRPRDPVSGRAYEQSDLAGCLRDRQTARDAVRYLVPPRSLPIEFQGSAANRVLMPGLDIDPTEVAAYLARRPAGLSENEWLRVLASHSLTPELAAMLSAGDLVTFVTGRQALLERRRDTFVRRMSEWDFEDTPPLSTFVLNDDDEDDDGSG